MNFKKLLLVFLALALCLGIVILMQGRDSSGEEIYFGGAKDGKTPLVDALSAIKCAFSTVIALPRRLRSTKALDR